MAQVLRAAGHPDAVGFEPVDEGPHTPPPDPLWQESTWVYWGDGAGSGGVVHIGQVPGANSGSVFASAYAGGSAYRRLSGPLELAASVRADGGHGAGGYSIRHEGGSSTVRAIDEDLEIDLIFKDLLPFPSLLAVFPEADDPAKAVTSTSYQTPGLVAGTVRLGTEIFTVDAMAQRGHSWGIRDHNALRGHGSRWATGGVPGSPTFHSYAAVCNDGTVVCTADVVDDGRVHYSRDVKMIVEFDVDGASAIGGRVELDCRDAGRYVFRCELESLNQFHRIGGNFSVCFGPATLDGRTERGWCAWEIQNGVQDPDDENPFFLRGYTENGLQS